MRQTAALFSPLPSLFPPLITQERCIQLLSMNNACSPLALLFSSLIFIFATKFINIFPSQYLSHCRRWYFIFASCLRVIAHFVLSFASVCHWTFCFFLWSPFFIISSNFSLFLLFLSPSPIFHSLFFFLWTTSIKLPPSQ